MTDFDFAGKSYFDADAGVYRWKSNDRIPFDDMLEENGVPAEIRAKCDEVRDAENAVAIEQYIAARAQRTPEQIAEENFEMLAAFGPGETVVNVARVTALRTFQIFLQKSVFIPDDLTRVIRLPRNLGTPASGHAPLAPQV